MQIIRLLTISGVVFPSVVATAQCDPALVGSYGWYMTFAFCMEQVLNNSPSITFTQCITAMTSAAPSGPCSSCLDTLKTTTLPFISSGDGRTYCVTSGATWSLAEGKKTWGSPECLNTIYTPLVNFNTCNGGQNDFVTGQPNARCTADEMLTLESTYYPYERLIAAAEQGVAVSAYAGWISKGFSTAISSKPCSACFDALFASVRALSPFPPECRFGKAMSSACVDGPLQPFLLQFSKCTGGYKFTLVEQPRYRADQKTVAFDFFRPFGSLVSCASTGSDQSIVSCIASKTGMILYDEHFSTCVLNFVRDMAPYTGPSVATGPCVPNPWDSGCIAAINTFVGPLGKFRVCAGFTMVTQPSLCDSTQWSTIPTWLKLAPVTLELVLGNSAISSEFEANIAVFPYTLNGSSRTACSVCFISLAVELYRNRDKYTVCLNDPFGLNCQRVLSHPGMPLDHFSQCSGYALSFDPTLISTQSGLSSALNIGMFVLAAETVPLSELRTRIGAAITSLLNSNMNIALCFMQAARGVDALSADQRMQCSTNVNSLPCILALSSVHKLFHTCSGRDLVQVGII